MTATAKTRTKPRAKKDTPPAPAAKSAAPAGPAIEFRSLDSLIPYARNARTHSAEQVAQLAASLIEFGFTNPVLADATGIVAGHGRVLAARQLYDAGKALRLPGGQPVPAGAIPVLDCTGWTEAQRRAYILADNQLAATSGWDFDMLAVEIDDLRDAGFDVSLLGFSREELNDLIGTPNLGPDPESDYTRKIVAPTYTPSGEKPAVDSLFDESKTKELKAKIDAAAVPEEVKRFLRVAADRHTVINFRRVADFYAHADAETQNLMEQSALVIIDFNKAIEYGFTSLSKALAEQYADDEQSVEDDNSDA